MFTDIFDKALGNLGKDYGDTIGATIKINQSESSIKDYNRNLEGGVHVSSKADYFISPEVEELPEYKKTHSKRIELMQRSMTGFYVACHCFAYLSGKENSFGDNWDKIRRIAANTIFRELGVKELYTGLNECRLEPKDFSINTTDRPIILESTIREALRRFPVPGFSFVSGSGKPFGKVNINKEIFIDRGEAKIIVIDRSPKPNFNPPVNENDENIIDVDPSELKIVDIEPNSEDSKAATEHPSDDIDVDDEKKEAKSPIVKFDPDKMVIFEESATVTLTKKQMEDFKKIFGKYFENTMYQINRIPSGAIEAVINNGDGMFSSYWFDPGLCIGGDWYVLGNFVDQENPQGFDTIPVHQSETELLDKIFADKRYMLTPDEVQKAKSHMFLNQRIYNVIDMSNMGGKIKKMQPDEFKKLGQKLTFIINCLSKQNVARFRFRLFNSIDEFELVSDNKCKSPFPGQTLINTSGAEVYVAGDDVTIVEGSTNSQYHIDNYGVL